MYNTGVANQSFSFAQEEDESAFRLVDNKPARVPGFNRNAQQSRGRGGNRGGFQGRGGNTGGAGARSQYNQRGGKGQVRIFLVFQSRIPNLESVISKIRASPLVAAAAISRGVISTSRSASARRLLTFAPSLLTSRTLTFLASLRSNTMPVMPPTCAFSPQACD